MELPMSKIMSALAVTTAALALTACSPAAEAPAANTQVKTPVATAKAPAMDAKVKAVRVYADWCGNCKVLDAKLQKVRAGHALSAVDFVVLDYTSKNADTFYAQAASAGVEAPLKAMFGDKLKTGTLVLIDADDNTVISKVTQAMSEAEILKAINAAVTAA